jgi:hypothetical protein
MADVTHHLAQFNIARLKAPLDAPELKEFVDFLDPVNAHADQMPGFVWRMTTPDGAASSFIASPFEDPLVITNLTVWSDLDSLRSFTYNTVHRYFLQSRRKWFAPVEGHQVVLWWVAAGFLPTLDEGVAQLRHLEAMGPTPAAFTMQESFDPAGNPVSRATPPARDDD